MSERDDRAEKAVDVLVILLCCTAIVGAVLVILEVVLS